MMLTKPAPATDAPRPMPTTVPVLRRLALRGSPPGNFGFPEEVGSSAKLPAAMPVDPWVESASAVGNADAPAVGVLEDEGFFEALAARLVELAGALNDDAEVGSVDGTVTALGPELLLEEIVAAGGGVDEEEGVGVEEEGVGVEEEGVGVDEEEGAGTDEEGADVDVDEGVGIDVEEGVGVDEGDGVVATDGSVEVGTGKDDFEDELVVTGCGAADGTDKDELADELLREESEPPCCGLRTGAPGGGTAASLKTAPGVSQHFARSSANPQQKLLPCPRFLASHCRMWTSSWLRFRLKAVPFRVVPSKAVPLAPR